MFSQPEFSAVCILGRASSDESRMPLMLASHWAEREFAECSRPDPRTVRSWIANGTIPGEIIGKQAYVDFDAWQKRTRRSGDDAVDALMPRVMKHR